MSVRPSRLLADEELGVPKVGVVGEHGFRPQMELSTGSVGREGVDPASPQWLGLTSDNEKVRTSALWNVNHVGDAYDPTFLDTLE